MTRILLLESEVYGVAGGLIGIPAGVLVLKLILNGMGKSLSQGLELPVVISPAGIALSLAVAVVVSLLSAWFPVRRASRLPIKDVVLGSVEEQAVSHRFIIGAGVLLFLISMVLPRLASGRLLYLDVYNRQLITRPHRTSGKLEPAAPMTVLPTAISPAPRIISFHFPNFLISPGRMKFTMMAGIVVAMDTKVKYPKLFKTILQK